MTESRPRSILHVTAPARLGGLESVVVALAGGQRDRGDRVAVVAVVEPGEVEGHPFLSGLRDRGIEADVLELPSRAYLRERGAVRSLARSREADVVHTHGYRSDVVDAPVARSLGIPTVTTVHGFTGGGWKNRIYEALQVRSFRAFDAVVGVSRPMCDELAERGVPRDRLHLHPNAWRPRHEILPRERARERLSLDPGGSTSRPGGPGSSQGPLHLGWVGRLSHEKAPDLFVESLGRLRDVDGWTASIVGEGPLMDRLEERGRELEIDDRVRWHGNVPGAGALMKAFDAFVLSSRTEGTPIVLLEAMAAGIPIVATRVGGVPDLLGDAAILVEPGSVDGLSSAVRSLHGDPDERARLARRALERLDHRADEDAWLDGYERIYDEASENR